MIHPTAFVDPTASLAPGVRIGPHCFVGPGVVLGEGCELRNHATVTGGTRCGPANVFYAGCVVGEDPQDLKFKGGVTRLEIGEDNVFRECVTVNRGTEVAGGLTRIGAHHRFIAYTHIAHDAEIGHGCILSNAVQLAGHVCLEDHVTMGGIIGVHHFTTLGAMSYVGGLTRIVADVPPFMIAEGNPSRIRGFNERGMSRWGCTDEQIKAVRDAYRTLFSPRADAKGESFTVRLDRLGGRHAADGYLSHLIHSIRLSLDHGVYGRQRERLRRDSDSDRQAYYGRAQESPT